MNFLSFYSSNLVKGNHHLKSQRKAKGRLQAAHKMRSMRRLETSNDAATALSALLGAQ
jgi:hypothetical protein